MPKCTFCKREYKEPRGLTIFTFDGKAIHYCSSKCRRNSALKRDGRKLNWIKKDNEIAVSLREEKVEEISEKKQEA